MLRAAYQYFLRLSSLFPNIFLQRANNVRFWAFALCFGGLLLFLDCEKRAGSPAAQGFLAMMLFVILLQHGYDD